ncbi:protein NO VEIN domain-containing protein [Pseudomonas viridiflava]|uniref:protein NO VEIN domain-containing protein n=1 Tax=Pseudomonas viridiflava TaxID=33069 RepID=UPI000F01DBA0|nr:DUF3883 domain-containing protein [Pseudomonas viridiflava]
MDAQLGREHAKACYIAPSSFNEQTIRSREYAAAALTELERLQTAQPEVMTEVLSGGNQGARLMNTDPFQGLREVVQNADDLGATCVRFGTRTFGGCRQLVIVHDGAPVELPHVLPMIYPFYSTKRQESSLKGRFGVGLKTLGRIGQNLTVHSPPFHFGSRNNHAVQVEGSPPIPGFYDPAGQHTLLTIDLDEEYDHQFLQQWFTEWTPSDLIFLDHVRSITVHEIDQGQMESVLKINPRGDAQVIALDIGNVRCNATRTSFSVDGLTWERYVCEVAVPPDKARDGKATGTYTPIGVALPSDGIANGRIHVALPTKIQTNTAFSLDAQFDPSTAREELVSEPWNKWLIETSAKVIGALGVYLAQHGSPLSWYIVPVAARTTSSSSWVNTQFAEQWVKSVETFVACPTLINGQFALSGVSYCDESADGLLTESDHLEVSGAPMLPLNIRDNGGRWRQVMDAIAASPQIGLSDLLQHCNADGFIDKSPTWLLDLAMRCVELPNDWELLDSRWVPLADGTRTVALDPDVSPTWLVSGASELDVVRRHQLCEVIHPSLREPIYKPVLDWLGDSANYVDDVTAEHALQAFSRRYGESPLEATHSDLLGLRDLFEQVAERHPTSLGLAVGQALLIEASHYEEDDQGRIKTLKTMASPAEVYLPSTIADVQDTWPRAAANTANLLWASSTYADVFKTSKSLKRDSSDSRSPTSRKRGAKRFLMLLGAANIPRFVPVTSNSAHQLLSAQADAKRFLGRAQGGLKSDFLAPDLDRVVLDLRRTKTQSKVKTNRRKTTVAHERAIALFHCIDSNWAQIEPLSSTYAVKDYYRQKGPEVPTTWLARLIEQQWFPDTTGKLCRPSTLVIRTKVTLALYDESRFATQLGEADANSQFARALGMEVNPSATKLVTALERARDDHDQTNIVDIIRLYQALAGHCPQGQSVPSQDTSVGDLTVASLRGKFGISRSRRGLIAPCMTTRATGDWLSPTAVFMGKDIFHSRQSFVLNDRKLTPLWLALNVGIPDLAACVRELETIAKDPYYPELDSSLIDIYRHMDQLLEKPTASDRRLLSNLPLLSNGSWSRKRPMHYCDFAKLPPGKINLWNAPCATDQISHLLVVLGLERLEISDRPRSRPSAIDDHLQLRVKEAIKILKTDLAREDEQSYRALSPWDRLDELTLSVHPEGELVIEVRPKDERPVPVNVRAHADCEAIALHFDHPNVIGRHEYGGLALSRFAGVNHRRAIALAWGAAWASSEDHIRGTDIQLAVDSLEASLEALIQQKERIGITRKKIGKQADNSAIPDDVSPETYQSRQLKALPDEFAFSTLLIDGAELKHAGLKVRKEKPLRDQPPESKTPALGTKAPAAARTEYDSAQLQKKAWAYVHAVFNSDEFPLADFQANRGVGADGAIGWEQFIEMKSFAREAPSQVILTDNEFRRARDCETNFYLVIVSGLEKGYGTELRVFSNPLGTLPWSPRGSISLGGLNKGAALILRENPTNEASSDDEATTDGIPIS